MKSIAMQGSFNRVQIVRFVIALLAMVLVPSRAALAQNPGVEFTLFPKNTGNGQMYVASIDGVSADGNSAAVSVGNAATFVGWWRRESGLTVLPPSVFLIDGIQRSASVLNISADGLTLVGTHSPPVIGSGDNINYVYLYSEAEGRRSIPQPFTPMPFVSGPVQYRLFAPTTDRIVSSRLWLGRNGGPPFADVVVWTSASNTWQPLSNQFPSGSYVEATAMSDTGVTIGYLYAGSYFGPLRYWVHTPVSGLVVYDEISTPPLTLQNISRSGDTIVGTRHDSSPKPMLTIRGSDLASIYLTNGSSAIATSSTDDASFFTLYRSVGPTLPVEYGVAWADGTYQSGSSFVASLGIQVPIGTTDVSLAIKSRDASVLYGLFSFGTTGQQFFLLKQPVPPVCDPIDFNNDGLFPTDEDVIDFLTVLAGGTCSNEPHCFDIDFNNDGLFPSDEDLIAFFRVFAGGGC
jgi:hypothetical protein